MIKLLVRIDIVSVVRVRYILCRCNIGSVIIVFSVFVISFDSGKVISYGRFVFSRLMFR